MKDLVNIHRLSDEPLQRLRHESDQRTAASSGIWNVHKKCFNTGGLCISHTQLKRHLKQITEEASVRRSEVNATGNYWQCFCEASIDRVRNSCCGKTRENRNKSRQGFFCVFIFKKKTKISVCFVQYLWKQDNNLLCSLTVKTR